LGLRYGLYELGDDTLSYHNSGFLFAPDVSIAADPIIGGGAAVIHDISEPGTYVGVPARRVLQSDG